MPKRPLDPVVAQRVLDRLDRVVAELRDIRVTVKTAKVKGGGKGV